MPNTLLDENQMQQVFINLLINAVEAIQKKGTIRIKSDFSPDKKIITVDIEDTGCGLSSKQKERIFEPFFSTKPKGTGLGLAVTYGIVQNHKGDIKVSSNPEKGTCFTITIPFAQPETPTETEGVGHATG